MVQTSANISLLPQKILSDQNGFTLARIGVHVCALSLHVNEPCLQQDCLQHSQRDDRLGTTTV